MKVIIRQTKREASIWAARHIVAAIKNIANVRHDLSSVKERTAAYAPTISEWVLHAAYYIIFIQT